MKTKLFTAVAIAAFCAISASAQDAQIKWYGFIRNYAHVDTHESVVGTADLFSYLPKDNDNDVNTWHLTAITSRLGIDVTGYQVGNMTASAKIETDFYSGVSGVTGTAALRLRLAYMTLGWNGEDGTSTALKVGQAYHPMTTDLPDVISLNTGAPFGPFSRTPLAQLDRKINSNWSLTAAAIWQMQYTSAGPEGASANYMKYSGVPEVYAGVNYTGANTIFRLGVDVLSIKPIQTEADRLTAISPFFYAQYKKDLFSVKFKTILAEAGEHVNLNGGYGLAADGGYTPTRNSSSWISFSYGKDWQWVLFGGFVKNFGTVDPLDPFVIPSLTSPAQGKGFYFSKNSFPNMNAMYRLTPTIIRNLGKVQVGLEYELTSVQYGDATKGFNRETGLYDQGLHWVSNNRVQMMLKYSF